MMFRPLALAAAFAGSIGLSSAEINYEYQSGEIASTQAFDDAGAPDTVGVLLASKSEFCASFSTNNFLILMLLRFSDMHFPAHSSCPSRCTRIKGLDDLSLL